MVREYVIDANVLGHAMNPAERFHPSAVELLVGLLESTDCLVFDDTSGSQDLDGSHLAHEYQRWVQVPGLAQEFFIRIVEDHDRHRFVGRPNAEVWRACQNLVRRNKRDCIFLGVATQTASRELISNDYNDFDAGVRTAARRQLSVDIIDSDEAA